jgi:hypothetical protein
VRVDYNINDNHRLSGSYAIIWAERDPDYLNTADANFPGAPNSRLFKSTRPIHTYTLRSTLSQNIVNELRFGITAKGGSSNFGVIEANRPGPASFDDLGGYAVDFDSSSTGGTGPLGLTNWYDQNGVSWRSVPTYEVSNAVTWQRGTHSLNFGGTWLLSRGWENEQQIVPLINLRFSADSDPAAGLFNGTNFPGAGTNALNDARALYALLTGRVGAISADIALNADTNQYQLLGPVSRAGGITVVSGFAQDTWRVSPTVTLNGGLRWDLQLPFTPSNSILSRVTLEDMCGMSGLGDGGTYSKCNFLSPGATGGVTPSFKQLTSGTNGYKTDWNNVAPTIGVAWRPNVQSGWLRTLLGDPDQATFRAGYSVAYERQGLSTLLGAYDGNPGSTVSLERSENSDFPLVPAGEEWPVLLGQTGRLGLPSFNPTPSFPIPIESNRGSDMEGFAPDVKIGSAHTWNVSWQRSITRDMAIEARYIGTYGLDQWSTLDYNQIRGENLIPNGFLDEFRKAMGNLAANNASGVAARRGSFAYFGENTGTSPLPIYLAYFAGRTDASNPDAYTNASTTWASSTIASRMSPANPSPITSAGDLDGNTTRRANAIRAGRPANFFVPNPDVDDVDVTDSGAYSDYNALQIELRRRLSRGLSANINYQFAIEGGSEFDGFSFGRRMGTTTGGAPRHAFKSQWDWTLPVGRGQRFGANLNPVLEGIVGGWSVNAVSRTQQRLVNFGNVRLVGMTKEDLQKVYKVRRANDSAGNPAIYMLPDDIITNTIRAWNISHTTLNGYAGAAPEGRFIAPPNSATCLQVRDGDCAPPELILRAPWFSRVDLGVTKKFALGGTRNIEVRFDVLNLFDNINFNPFITSTDSDDDEQYFGDQRFGEVLAAYTDASNTYDPGGRIGQLMLRFNW